MQETLKELEASLKKLETEKEVLIEENKNLKSSVEVLQSISRVQDEATEQLGHAANTSTGTSTGQGNQGITVSELAAADKSDEVRSIISIAMPQENNDRININENESSRAS